MKRLIEKRGMFGFYFLFRNGLELMENLRKSKNVKFIGETKETN